MTARTAPKTRPMPHDRTVLRKPLTEDVLTPLCPGGQAEEERPDGQQDREDLESVERPAQADGQGEESDDDAFE